MNIEYLTSTPRISPAENVIGIVESGHVPRYLYKYRDDGEYSKKIIKNKALWYPRPLTFNDPFDCQLEFDTKAELHSIERFLRINNKKMSKDELRTRALYYYKNPKILYDAINRGAKNSFNNHGLCCFTIDPANILMWSYYANSHRGMCLKFDLLADPVAFFIPLKVDYVQEYPYWNHIKGDNNASVTKLASTKAKQWEHEQEYRILKFRKSGSHSFDGSALQEIIFGCQASAPFIKDVQALAKTADMEHIIFSKAHVSKTEFKLEIKPL